MVMKMGDGFNTASRSLSNRRLSKAIQIKAVFCITRDCSSRTRKRIRRYDLHLRRQPDYLSKRSTSRNYRSPSFRYYRVNPYSCKKFRIKKTIVNRIRNVSSADVTPLSLTNILQTLATVIWMRKRIPWLSMISTWEASTRCVINAYVICSENMKICGTADLAT